MRRFSFVRAALEHLEQRATLLPPGDRMGGIRRHVNVGSGNEMPSGHDGHALDHP